MFTFSYTLEELVDSGKNNYTRQSDMFTAFSMLFKKKILNEDLCNKAIDILYGQRNFDQLLRFIPDNVQFAHKTGTLAYVNIDVGVMNIDGKLYFVGATAYN